MNFGPLLFAAPWLLLALPALPLLWWLLRVTPPSPRRQSFPPTRLLRDLPVAEETPARTPWWLLLLRLAAAALIVLGLARPIWDAAAGAGGQGPLLIAIDNGWPSAADWPQRMATARAALEAAGRDDRPAALLATTPSPDGQPPAPTAPMPAREAATRLAALRPQPWAPDRAAAAAALASWRQANGGQAASLFITDGLTHASGDSVLAEALAAMGPLTVAGRDPALPTRILPPPVAEADRLHLTIRQTPSASPGEAAVLARTADGRTLARATVAIPAGADRAEGALELPLEIREQVVRLELEGETGAAGSVLLDERFRRRPVGLLAGDGAADTPLTGALFYLDRALQPFVEVRRGSLETLLSRKLAVLVLADYPLTEAREVQAVTRFVEQGGLLLRFAGPRMAEHPDPLLPVTLRAGERQLGGSLSWEKPQPLAAFPDNSPFTGLAVPPEVTIRTQVLAEPAPRLSERTWAALADGTPLVTGLGRGAGRIVLVHVTANADWSDLPLSGLFVDMLRRLVALSSGVVEAEGTARLAPIETMDGFGHLGPAPATATAIVARDLAATLPGPAHPPGWYGTPGEGGERRALNLSTHVPALVPAPPPPAGARSLLLGGVPVERDLGPWLLAAALLLLAVDLVLSLVQRGLLGREGGAGRVSRRAAMLALLLPLAWAAPAWAQGGRKGGARGRARTRRCWGCGGGPGPGHPPRLCRHRRRGAGRGLARRPRGAVGLCEPPDGGEPGRARGGAPGGGRPLLLPAALLAGLARCGRSRRPCGGGGERLHAQWRHRALRHARRGLGRGHGTRRQGSAAPGDAEPGHPAPRAAAGGPCAAPRLLPAVRGAGALGRRHGLGGARRGPRQ